MTNKENWKEIYEDTISECSGCCDASDPTPFEEMDGVCPKCGRATSDGCVVTSCNYSPCECKECGASPCDGSC